MRFTQTPQLRTLEKMMTHIPKFRPRGHGIVVMKNLEYTAQMCDCKLCLYNDKKEICTVERCPYTEERIIAGAASFREVMEETMIHITNPAFCKRLNEYIKESEGNPMRFKSEKHRQVFAEAIARLDRKNYAVLAAVYLLSADSRLWNQSKQSVERNVVSFGRFKPKSASEDGYTLFCAAKDLYAGTKHITVSDLADTELISPKLFALICNAMAIRRFGLGAIGNLERRV